MFLSCVCLLLCQDIPFDIHTLCIVSIRRRNSFTAKKFPPLFLYVSHDFVTRNVTVVSAACDTSWLRCASRWKTESEHLIIPCYTLALALLYKVKRTAFDSSVRQSREWTSLRILYDGVIFLCWKYSTFCCTGLLKNHYGGYWCAPETRKPQIRVWERNSGVKYCSRKSVDLFRSQHVRTAKYKIPFH